MRKNLNLVELPYRVTDDIPAYHRKKIQNDRNNNLIDVDRCKLWYLDRKDDEHMQQ
jgi:hypothetical protein